MKHFKNVHVGKHTLIMTSVPTKLVTPQPIKIKIDNSDQNVEEDMVPWGSDNLYPQNFYQKKFLKNGASVGGINTLKSTIHGNGFGLFKKVRNAKGVVELQEQLLEDFPDIDDFVVANKLDKFWYGKITDQSLFQIAFTEHVISANGQQIVRVKRHKAAQCRFAKMDKSGSIPYVFVNTDWATGNKEFTIAIPFFDHLEATVQEIKDFCKEKGIFNFMTSSFYPLVTESYYPQADWHAVDRSGWMDVANSVPELKQALFENQMHFKYMIYISDFYFESFYKEEWDQFDAEKRQEMRQQLADTIDDHMSGNDASGRSLISPIFDENGKPVKGITIDPVDNKLKDGSYLPDASAANSEILFAIGVNPAIIGAGTPGGSNLGGSGSNIREAYTVLSASLAPKRNYVTDDWDFWREFNNWDRRLIGAFPGVNLTTLDKNPNGQENILNK